VHNESPMRRPKPLVVRAGLGRTFGSLIGFAAALFLTCGIYILEDAFAHPLDAQAAGLIFAACVIALAALLLFYLFKPRTKAEASNSQIESDSSLPMKKSIPRVSAVPVYRNDSRKDLAYQRIYVDHSRIRR
jgi:hypothetical protein